MRFLMFYLFIFAGDARPQCITDKADYRSSNKFVHSNANYQLITVVAFNRGEPTKKPEREKKEKLQPSRSILICHLFPDRFRTDNQLNNPESDNWYATNNTTVVPFKQSNIIEIQKHSHLKEDIKHIGLFDFRETVMTRTITNLKHKE